MSRFPCADFTKAELERFQRFEREAMPVFGDIITAHVWLAKFSLQICKGTITRREAIRESEDGLQQVLMELRTVNASDKKVLQEPTA